MKKSSVIKTCYESSHIYMYLNLYLVIILIMVVFFIGELSNKNFHNQTGLSSESFNSMCFLHHDNYDIFNILTMILFFLHIHTCMLSLSFLCVPIVCSYLHNDEYIFS